MRHASGDSLIAIDLISEHADAQRPAASVGQSHGTGETLILGRIVVLQTDLKLNRLNKVTLLGLERILQNGSNGLVDNFSVKLGHLRNDCTR